MPICPIYLPSFDIADHHPLTGYLAQMSHQLRRDLRGRTVYQPVCSRLMKVAQPALGFAYNFFFSLSLLLHATCTYLLTSAA